MGHLPIFGGPLTRLAHCKETKQFFHINNSNPIWDESWLIEQSEMAGILS